MVATQVATRIIDGDGHIVEEEDNIISHLREPYRNARIRRGGLFPAIDHLHYEPFTPLPGAFSPAGPEQWEQFLETVGIESTVLYPSQGLAIGNATNRDWTIALTMAYNDWLHARYMKRSSRFKGMALIPMQDPEAAVVELRRAVLDLGMLGGMIPSNGLSHSVGSKQYWPVYAEAERLGCALAVHGGIHAKMGLDYLDVFSATHAIGHPLGQIISATSIIFNGVFDKFPGVRIAFLEGGVAWLLMLLERYDRSYWTHYPFNPRGDILQLREGEKVAGYMIRQMKERRMFIGCEGEEPSIAYAVKTVGNEPFFFSSDFPHEVNIEMCQHELGEIVDNHELTDADKQAILYQNSAAFYKL
ncbi:MAG: amidohydrolase family protein [Chloroflexota bacterium]